MSAHLPAQTLGGWSLLQGPPGAMGGNASGGNWKQSPRERGRVTTTGGAGRAERGGPDTWQQRGPLQNGFQMCHFGGNLVFNLFGDNANILHLQEPLSNCLSNFLRFTNDLINHMCLEMYSDV